MATPIEDMIELGDDGLTLIKVNNLAIKDGTFTIPHSVTHISRQAFQGCTSLSSINIPDSVTNIGPDIFGGCTSLSSITMPDSITDIGIFTFSDCTNLSSINIPNSVIYIGGSAFKGCTSLSNITIPHSLTDIDDTVFEGCISLSNIIVDSDYKDEIARITALISDELRSKVINKQQHIEAQNIHKAPLRRITNDPNTTNANYLSHPNINHDVVLLIAAYLENNYADNAKKEMLSLKIPTNNNWDEYTKKVNDIADKHVSQARVDHANEMSAILKNKQEKAHPYLAIAINHPNITSGVAGLLVALAVVAIAAATGLTAVTAITYVEAATMGTLASTATFFAIPSSLSAYVASQNKVDAKVDDDPAAKPTP